MEEWPEPQYPPEAASNTVFHGQEPDSMSQVLRARQERDAAIREALARVAAAEAAAAAAAAAAAPAAAAGPAGTGQTTTAAATPGSASAAPQPQPQPPQPGQQYNAGPLPPGPSTAQGSAAPQPASQPGAQQNTAGKQQKSGPPPPQPGTGTAAPGPAGQQGQAPQPQQQGYTGYNGGPGQQQQGYNTNSAPAGTKKEFGPLPDGKGATSETYTSTNHLLTELNSMVDRLQARQGLDESFEKSFEALRELISKQIEQSGNKEDEIAFKSIKDKILISDDIALSEARRRREKAEVLTDALTNSPEGLMDALHKVYERNKAKYKGYKTEGYSFIKNDSYDVFPLASFESCVQYLIDCYVLGKRPNDAGQLVWAYGQGPRGDEYGLFTDQLFAQWFPSSNFELQQSLQKPRRRVGK